jgi:HPt (histidine-containing phosphotransfer) domain-containing protein
MALEFQIENLVSGGGTRLRPPWKPPAEILDLGVGLAGEVVEMFRVETAADLSRMSELLSAANFDGVKTEAHHIKGGARQLGLVALASLCQEVEAAAQGASPPELEERLACLQAEFASVCADLGGFSASLETSASQPYYSVGPRRLALP